MLLQRILVTATLGPLGVYLIYLGGLFYFLPVFALLLIATWEYAHLARHIGWQVSPWLLLPLVAALLVEAQWPQYDLYAHLLVLGVFVPMVAALWHYERRSSPTVPADWLATAAGVLLLGGIGGYFFRLRGIPEMAVQWTIMAMVGTWIADSGAYVFGRTLGRHKLSPRLSPNKTVEGYVGGIFAGTLTTVLLAYFFDIPLALGLLLGLVVSGVSPAGDLGISLLKREAGVKDSGHLLPGHGGALDRIDSLLWSVAFAYFLAPLL